MNFLGFTLSVWAAIALGVFFIAMTAACTADRQHRESPKWFVLAAGVIGFAAWHWWNDIGFDWRGFFTSGFWKAAGIYLGWGVAYAAIEFWFQIRREAREWARLWESFKESDRRRLAREAEGRTSFQSETYGHSVHKTDSTTSSSLEKRFVEHSNSSECRRFNSHNLTTIALDAQNAIVPVLDKKELAESIGCWTVFWPAYAVSLALGDFLAEIGRRLADLFAALSGRFVRRSFAKAFTR